MISFDSSVYSIHYTSKLHLKFKCKHIILLLYCVCENRIDVSYSVNMKWENWERERCSGLGVEWKVISVLVVLRKVCSCMHFICGKMWTNAIGKIDSNDSLRNYRNERAFHICYCFYRNIHEFTYMNKRYWSIWLLCIATASIRKFNLSNSPITFTASK